MATVHGNNSNNWIDEWDGVTNWNDTIYGYGGSDTIFALDGDDLIVGGHGADTIYGGDGIDTASYSDSNHEVTVSLSTNTGSGGSAEGDSLNSIENLTGSAYNDTLIGDNGVNVLNGGGGNDMLKGGGGTDTLNGDAGNDTLKGGGGADTLNGGSGTDTASYAESSGAVYISLIDDYADGADATGDDLNSIENLTGSSYGDQLWGNNGINVLNGNAGDDTLKGYGGADTLNGGDGNDYLLGMEGVDILNGGNGDDVLDGGVNNDTMSGGMGNDEYYVNHANDIVNELAGQGDNDIVYSQMISYTLAENVEILSLAASLGAFNGTGNAQSNTIFGNANNNVLNGGAGSDALSGLGGNDTFVFVAGQAHGDVVYEFDGNGAGVGDVLQFVGYGPGATLNQYSEDVWIVASADGSIQEAITLIGAPDLSDFGDYVFV